MVDRLNEVSDAELEGGVGDKVLRNRYLEGRATEAFPDVHCRMRVGRETNFDLIVLKCRVALELKSEIGQACGIPRHRRSRRDLVPSFA